MATECSRPPQEPMCPIARLPPEILGIIFNHVAANMQHQYALDSLQSANLTTQPYDWVYLSHVCRYWKGVVLLDPCLPSADTRLEELLLRGHDVSIQHLHVGKVVQKPATDGHLTRVKPSIFRMITQNLPRTQKFTMTINHPPSLIYEQPLKHVIEGDCNNLMHINFWSPGRSVTSPIPSLVVNSLSGLPLRSLQSLTLTRYTPSMSSKLFRHTLKELYLDNNHMGFLAPDQDQIFQPKMLLDSLKEMPRLEILSLKYCMDSSVTQNVVFTKPQPVELLMLRILHLSDAEYIVDKFLICLGLPLKTKLVIEAFPNANSTENHLPTLMTTISK